jgi:hypothetical protein
MILCGHDLCAHIVIQKKISTPLELRKYLLPILGNAHLIALPKQTTFSVAWKILN